MVAWADETIERIVEGHPEQFKLLPIIGSSAGLRQGELFGLALEDFDFDEHVIRVRRQVTRLRQHFVFALPKNDQEHIVPMSPILEAAVTHHIERFGTKTISLP